MGKFSSLILGALSGAAAAYFLTSKKGKETTKKVRDFVKDYQENPEDVHEAVVQSAKDFSNQAVNVINQTKEKVENGEITTETVLESVKETTKSVVDYSQDKFQEIKDKFDKEVPADDFEPEADSTEDQDQAVAEVLIDEVQESEDIVIDLDPSSPVAPETNPEKED